MMHKWNLFAGAVLLALVGCARQQPTFELAHFPLDGTDQLIAQSGVKVDPAVSADGHGSLQVVADEPTTVRLFEVSDLNLDATRLSYQAELRTADVEGRVYLEMWCRFPGQGEFFSRALYAPLSGSNDWTSQSTDFMLKKGERPDLVRLNLVVDGKGTAWIDDVHLYSTPM
jgi:hypothetical protein